jgi:hypothetical protein
LTFLSAFCGLPRPRRINSCAAFSPIISGSTSAAGRALVKSSFVHSGLSSSGRKARSFFVFFAVPFYLSFVCLAEADELMTCKSSPRGVHRSKIEKCRVMVLACSRLAAARTVPISSIRSSLRDAALRKFRSGSLSITARRRSRWARAVTEYRLRSC